MSAQVIALAAAIILAVLSIYSLTQKRERESGILALLAFVAAIIAACIDWPVQPY